VKSEAKNCCFKSDQIEKSKLISEFLLFQTFFFV
jgi:hypothetical protein